jgi:hypothetical protein
MIKVKDSFGKDYYHYGRMILDPIEINSGNLSYNNMINMFCGECGVILNNNIKDNFPFEIISGGVDDDYEDEVTIYQYFIISEDSANKLMKHTNEIILYNDDLDMYLLGVTHFGTSWSILLTDFTIIDRK